MALKSHVHLRPDELALLSEDSNPKERKGSAITVTLPGNNYRKIRECHLNKSEVGGRFTPNLTITPHT